MTFKEIKQECPGCHEMAMEDSTSTCMGYHYRKNSTMNAFLTEKGVDVESLCHFDDFFYCKKCLNEHGFCKKCQKIVPSEYQPEEFDKKITGSCCCG